MILFVNLRGEDARSLARARKAEKQERKQVVALLCGCVFAGPLDKCFLEAITFTCKIPYGGYLPLFMATQTLWPAIELYKVCVCKHKFHLICAFFDFAQYETLTDIIRDDMISVDKGYFLCFQHLGLFAVSSLHIVIVRHHAKSCIVA